MTLKSGATSPPKEKKPTTKLKADKVTETAATVVATATKAPEEQPEKPVTTDDAVAGNDTIAGGESLAGTVTGEAKAPEEQPEKPVTTDDAVAGGEAVAGTVTFDPKVMVVVGSDIHGMNDPLVHIDDAGFGIHLKGDDEPIVNEVNGDIYPRVVVMNNPTAHTVTEPSSRVYAEPYRQSKPHTLNNEAEYLAMQKGVDNHNARLKLETGITIIDFVGV